MGLFEELVNGVNRRNAQRDAEEARAQNSRSHGPITAELGRPSRSATIAQQNVARADRAIERVTGNQASIDSTAAVLAQSFSPTVAKPKFNKFASKTDAVDAAMGDTPQAGIAGQIKNAYANKLAEAQGTGKSLAEVQAEAVSSVVTPDLIQKSYEHKAKADSSIKNMFGLFGESNVRAVDGTKIGTVSFEDWKSRVKAGKAAEVSGKSEGLGLASLDAEQLKHDFVNASLVGGGNALLVAGGALVAGTAAAVSAPVIIGGALVAGALAVPAGRVAGALSRAYENSDFGTFHSKDAQGRIFGGAVGAGALALGGKGAGAKAVLGAIGGTVGAVNPALGVDLLGWTGAEAALATGGEKLLYKAIKAGKVNESSFEALRTNSHADTVIRRYESEVATAKAESAVKAEALRSSTEKALYEAEFSRLEAGEGLLNTLKRRKQEMMPTETGATVSKELRGPDGDVVKLAGELQQERRLATPGGPNAFEGSSTATPAVSKRKGKKGTGKGAAAVVDQQSVLEREHFNAFLDDMKMSVPDAEAEVYSSLFNAAHRPTDLSNSLSKLSWDGVDKVIGDGAEMGWKTLGLGERIQIVSGAEEAAHAALVRSAGVAPGADRLGLLAKPLAAALKKGMKLTPEEMTKELEAVVAGPKSPYNQGGKLDLLTLQTDLADSGFESVQQLAFATGRQLPKVNEKKFAAMESAMTVLRNSNGSNLVKLGVGGATVAGATLYDPEMSHAGVITDLARVGSSGFIKKIWGNFMQKFNPTAADELMTKAGFGGSIDFNKVLTDRMLSKLVEDGHVTKEAAKNWYDGYPKGVIDQYKSTYKGAYPDLDTNVTLAEIRNAAVEKHPNSINGVISWNNEQKLLRDMGIDTENLIMTHGTGGGHVKPTYSTSGDDNLLGPGIYTTSGVVRDGIEDISKGYANARTVSGGPTAANTRQLILTPKKVFDADAARTLGDLKKEFPEVFANNSTPDTHVINGWDVHGIMSQVDGPLSEIHHKNFITKLLEQNAVAAAELRAVPKDALSPEGHKQLQNALYEIEHLDTTEYAGVRTLRLADEILRSAGVRSKFESVAGELSVVRDAGYKRITNDYLKSKGYDAITHIGGASKDGHRVMIALDDNIVLPFLPLQEAMASKYNLLTTYAGRTSASLVALGAIATSALTPDAISPQADELSGNGIGDSILAGAEQLGKILDPVVSLLSPTEANAGTIETMTKMMGGLKVSGASAAVIKDAAGEGVNALKYAHDAGLLFKDVPKGAVSAEGIRTSYLNTAPNGASEIGAVVRRLDQAVPGQGFTTPYFSSQTLLKTANDGDRFLGNPAVQLAHGQSVVSHHVRQTFDILDNIYNTNGVKLQKANSDAIAKTMAPVQKEYDAVSAPLRANEIAAIKLREDIAYHTEKAAADPEYAAGIATVLDGKSATLEALNAEIKGGTESFLKAKEKVEIHQRALADQFPEARISLAVEDTVDFQKRPWLRDMLSPSEKNAVLQIQNLMGEYKSRIVSTMGKDAVLSGEYVKHSRVFSKEQGEVYAKLEERLNNAGLNGKEVIALTKLHERTKYSQQMIPDIGRNMADYVPDVETRLMNADFWKVNKPGGWDAFRKSSTVQNSPALKGMFDRIAESAKPPEETMLRNLSNKYTKFESIRLLAALPSAPAKHLMKLVGDVSQLGLLTTTSVMADAAAMATRNFVRHQAEKLAKVGFIDGKTAAGLFNKTKDVDSFVAGITNQRKMVDYLSDIEKNYGVGHRDWLDKILDPMSDFAGAGIKVIETFDRTTSVLAAAKMAEKAGMTRQQAMYGIYDTILKNNFLSGQLNSAWAKDPNVRALFLFQNTPFKIWERRVMNAVVAGGDLRTALGVIKKQDLPGALAELQGMKKWAAQATQAFKKGLIQDALGSSKDVFGTSVSSQFMKEALAVGGLLAGGTMAGVNLTGHLMHTPFVGPGFSGDPTVSMSPISKAAWYAAGGKKPAGFDDWDEEDHSTVADFFKHWYGTAGYSLMASKVGRIGSDDIPEQYAGSKFKFLFAMPATKDRQERGGM